MAKLTGREEEVVRRVRAGERQTEIARDLGVTISSISLCVRRHAPELSRTNPTPAQRAVIIKAIKAGMPVAEAALKYGYAAHTLSLWLKRGVGTREPVDAAYIVQLYETGDYTMTALGAAYGVSRERVRQIIAAANLSKSRREIQIQRVASQAADIRQRYLAGEEPADLALALDVDRPVIEFYVEGCSRQAAARMFNYEDMIADYRSGTYTTTALAEKYNTSQTNISAVLQRHGVDTKEARCAEKRRHIPERFRAKCSSLRQLLDTTAVVTWFQEDESRTALDLAELCGVTPATILRITTTAGVKTGRKRRRRKPLLRCAPS
ncbi:RNA polymerase [Brevundimonas phage vB_BpoS-Papperlapapp]|nr:RNA polymerase [Brevundimonas phage vB_BpoS-Papperlapapp]